MAEQLQQSNPGLVNNLRETMQQMSPNSGGESKEDQSTEGTLLVHYWSESGNAR